MISSREFPKQASDTIKQKLGEVMEKTASAIGGIPNEVDNRRLSGGSSWLFHQEEQRRERVRAGLLDRPTRRKL